MSILGLALVAMGVTSCNGKEGSEKAALEGGGDFTQHINAGNPKPNPGDIVLFHAYVYNGDSLIFSTRMQGDEEQAFQVPTVEDPNQPLSPIQEALSKMGAGDSASVAINIDTLPRKPQGFENASEILYNLAVKDVMTEEAYKVKKEEDRKVALDTVLQKLVNDYKPGAPTGPLQSTDSGLEYLTLEEGTGAQPQAGQQVKVQYRGVLLNGQTFDSSFSHGEPISFALGQRQVIPGWDEGIALMKKGGKALLVIPPNLGYGPRGNPPVIPPNAYLVFYVELVGIE